MRAIKVFLAASMAGVAVFGSAAATAASAEQRNLEELRNTVVNLLQGLVAQGVITREAAEKMVKEAREKAEAEVARTEQQEKEEAGAIRVPYVPQVVKDELRKQVAEDLSAEVTRNVVDQAKSENWALPGAMPDWVTRMRWTGDVRVRAQADLFASDNAPNLYLNFQAVNDAGGIGKAGLSALANVTEDRRRARVRARFGFETDLGYGWKLGTRLATGTLRDPVSTNQTLGNTSNRYQTALDLAYLEWAGTSSTGRQTLTVSGGRIRSPWFSTNLVWDDDVTFEGLAANYHFGLLRDDPNSNFMYVTAGAFPIQEVELARDKWLLGGQLGVDWKFSGGSRFRIGAALYDYRNITGRRNSFGSNLLDYTAPQFLQRGNTLFDIRNDNDDSTNLFALAPQFRLADATASFEWRLAPGYRLMLTGDYVRNVGYDRARVNELTGLQIEPRTTGYQAEVGFGSTDMTKFWAWRGYFGYRHLERDAVLDAFTDSDFRLGGTDVKGYYIGADLAITPRVTARLRYLSGSEIDGPPLSMDVAQFDVVAQF